MAATSSSEHGPPGQGAGVSPLGCEVDAMLIRNPLQGLANIFRRTLPQASRRQKRARTWRSQEVERLERRTLLTTITYHSTDTPLDVPPVGTDEGAIISTLTVSDHLIIGSLQVGLDIQHTYDSDLTAELISPDGTRIMLFDAVGEDGEDFSNTVLDDYASASINSASAPFSGTFQPAQLLDTFSGQDSFGTWQLVVTDSYSGDSGFLTAWSLTVSDEIRDDEIRDVGETLETGLTLLLGYFVPITVQNSISTTSDVDLFAVTLQQGDTLTADINGSDSSTVVGVLRVFDSSGAELASNENTAGSSNSQVRTTITTSGTYYVGVSGSGNSTYDPNAGSTGSGFATGSYTLRFSRQDDAGNTLATAKTEAVDYGVSVTTDAVINYEDDVDLFAVVLQAGDLLTASIDTAESWSQVYRVLRIFDSQGVELDANATESLSEKPI